MKHTSETKKAIAHTSNDKSAAGPGGISIAPPAYGIESLDRSLMESAPETGMEQHVAGVPVQMKARPAIATAKGPMTSAVIQRRWEGWWWPWNWGKKKEADPYADLLPSERQAAMVNDNIARQEHGHRRRQNMIGGPGFEHASPSDISSSEQAYQEHREHSYGVAQAPTIKSRAEKVRGVSGGVSGLGTIGTHIGQVVGNDALGTTGRITGGIGGGVGVLGSLIEAGTETEDIIESDDKKKDKAIRAVGVLGSLANATNSGASGVGQVSGLISGTGTVSSIASTASAVAAPAAIAKGGADVITGLATGGLAHYRSNKLQEIQDRDTGAQRGIARFAQENQWNKAKSNYGKAAGGALGVAGGALLLAAGLSNPVGWALLAGAGLLGLGFAAYKMYKKHKQGKQIANDPEYQRELARNNINVPTDEELGPGKWTDIFKTRSMRRQEVVRGMIGMRLAENEQRSHSLYDTSDGTLSEIGSHLGVKRLDPLAAPLLGEQRDEQKMKRARSYARALDY